MGNDNRGTITQKGGIMQLENALVEEVAVSNNQSGFIVASYSLCKPNGLTFIELIRLNINRNTLILNSNGLPINLSTIKKGMWIDSLFSPIMTRSIPPQSNAFLVVVRKDAEIPMSVTTDRIAMIDVRNNFLYTGIPNDINSQMRFVITNTTTITGRNGNPIGLRNLRPGQMVRVTHYNFQTASIPPQTTAVHIQVL